MSLKTIPSMSLISAMIIYALFSSPTPNSISAFEVIIAALLIIACIGSIKEIHNKSKYGSLSALQLTSLCALVAGLTFPVINGLLNNNQNTSIARDIIAYLYLFLPFFTRHLSIDKNSSFKIWIATICFISFSFTIRDLNQQFNLPLSAWIKTENELTYFANSPLILLTSGLSYALLFLQKTKNIRGIFIKITCVILCVLTLAVMATTLQRASLASFILIAISVHIDQIIKAPKAGILTILALAILISIACQHTQPFIDILNALSEKTQIHGLNKRAEEWSAIFEIVTASWRNALFGQGWGAGFYSPATDLDYVFFTHSLISALLFKTGLLGLLAIMPYIFLIYASLYNLAKSSLPIALCFAAPITIDIALYGAYKSLDFGLILICLFAAERIIFTGRTPKDPTADIASPTPRH